MTEIDAMERAEVFGAIQRLDYGMDDWGIEVRVLKGGRVVLLYAESIPVL
jgi:hypothetical protein